MKFRVFLADNYGWKKEIIVIADTPEAAREVALKREPGVLVKKIKAIRGD